MPEREEERLAHKQVVRRAQEPDLDEQPHADSTRDDELQLVVAQTVKEGRASLVGAPVRRQSEDGQPGRR